MTNETVQIPEEVMTKEAKLEELIKGYGTIAVAYSGGVDSTYLADVAHDTLGEKAAIILADSPSLPRTELEEASALAKERNWNFVLVHTKEFEEDGFLKNEGNRCYFCRSELFKHMRSYADEQGIEILAYGAIVEDAFDPTRVGAIAAKENGVVSPLQDADLNKDEIRQLSRRRGLPTSEKASFACLASRVPKGTRVTTTALSQVEQCEEVLKSFGFHQYRVRHHENLCRIEIDLNDIDKILDNDIREQIVRDISATGYRFVTLDLAGYRTGSTA